MDACNVKKPNAAWVAQSGTDLLPAEPLTIEMTQHGNEALKALGQHPRNEGAAYMQFHQSHFGQVEPPVVDFGMNIMMPPCALHLILTVHHFFFFFLESYPFIVKEPQARVTNWSSFALYWLPSYL